MTEQQHPPLLIPERVEFKKKIESKKCVFDSLTKLLEKGQSEVSRNDIFDALILREKLGDTYIGNGIALPRAHTKITNPRAALLILKKGLNLNTADKLDIRLFFAILIPQKNQDEYAVMLSGFNKKLLKDKKIDQVVESGNAELVAQYFDKLF